MNTIYRYSIVRFRPSADLGEFANIGIVALDAGHQGLQFKLARQRFRRLREFFGDDAYRAYASVIEHLRIELAHLAARNGFWSKWEPKIAFSHLTRSHESSIIFSDTRMLMSSDAIEDVVDMLFSRLVMRQHQEGHDLGLIKDIKRELKVNGVKGFRAFRIDDPIVPVTFPLARWNGDFSAIHPLVFTQKTSLSVFDYGALWKRRLNYLLDHQRIKEGSVLLALEPPNEDVDDSVMGAYSEAINEMRSLPFETVQAEIGGRVNHRIIEFAQATAPQRYSFFN